MNCQKVMLFVQFVRRYRPVMSPIPDKVRVAGRRLFIPERELRQLTRLGALGFQIVP
jgi:hypothetical protein